MKITFDPTCNKGDIGMIGVAMGVGKGLNRLAHGGHERLPRGERPRHYGRAALALTGAGVGIGLVLANGHMHESTTEASVEGGVAEVTHIDKTFSEINIIGFTTRVDGVFAEVGEKNRSAFGIPLPDLTTNLTVSNFVVQSSLCMPAKEKTIDFYPAENKYVVHIDPADISVCSKQDLSVEPDKKPGGSWAQAINDSSNDIDRAIGNDAAAVKKENEVRTKLDQSIAIKAIYDVNKECAPKVFKVARDNFTEEVIKQTRRDKSETIEVVYDVEAGGKVAISGKSDMDAIIAKMQADGVDIKGGLVDECKLPQTENSDNTAAVK